MISKDQIENIIENFIEYLYDETGIRLKKEEIKTEVGTDILKLLFEDVELCETEIDTDDIDEEDIAFTLIENAGNIKSKLTEIKISTLESNIEDKYNEIRKHIAISIGEEKAEGLFIEVKEIGYDQKHYMTDDESSVGYPIIVLSISDFDEIDFVFELNIYYPEDALDMKELFAQLTEYFN